MIFSREILIGSSSGTNCSKIQAKCRARCVRSACSRSHAARRITEEGSRMGSGVALQRSPGFLVADVDRLSGRIADRIVAPGRDLVLLRIQRPGAAGAVGGDQKAELRIGDDIDPGRGRPLAVVENDHIFARLRVKSAQPVEELERAWDSPRCAAASAFAPPGCARRAGAAGAVPRPLPVAAWRADRARMLRRAANTARAADLQQIADARAAAHRRAARRPRRARAVSSRAFC